MKRYDLLSLCGLMTMIGFAACSDNENNALVSEVDGYVNNLVVTVDNNRGAGPDTRQLILDDDNNVISKWAKNDKLFVYNLSDNNGSKQTTYSLVETNGDGTKQTTYRGKVKSHNKVKKGDIFTFFYPGSGLEEGSIGLVSNIITSESNQGVTISYHDQSSTITNFVSLDLKKQDGTLESIDKKFDFNWGTDVLKTVPVDKEDIKLKPSLKRKIAIWGLKFKVTGDPSSSGEIADIDSVKINGLRSYDVLDLSNGEFVGTNDEKEYAITIANKDKTKLQLTNGYVWVALLAENAETKFTITLYTQQGAFTKTATKKFETDYDYRTVITVEKVVPQPYVEVNNVKWATGNFIHYNTGSAEYWGIAPAQWWISSYGENPTSVNKADNQDIKYDGLGSQNWFIDDHIGRFTQTEEDVDLFQWGVIQDALKFNGVYYLQGTNFDMAGKYYKNRGGLVHVNETSNRAEATHGDIVRYYTEHGQKHYHYQYPSDADFNALFSANTSIPAYCYTDKGNKIYGAYFSDTKFSGTAPKFPTGRKIWKYQDVTGLVLANQGLFLPIGGRRPINSASVEFRHVAYNSGFYGQYYTSQSTTYSIPHGVFFGAAFKMNIAVPSKDQGSNIRPVYVGAENNDETQPIDAAKFAAFSNIIDVNGRKH
ncbi:hypothetical protein J4856_00265 [Prevotella scopos JCM 17725]|uniref:DUF4906 domain-containing protein n=1 Tax=Prevotella scopos JCM 17725 TaxID=1236518 RepID=A0AAX2F805_9BACT|nr:hypothetical protein [Prevotella scopos]QUB44463.1 hypothetical protein J4856_00265 [Prevotella scopos JCM 17725]SHG20301.1 hypothetical protein SAMN05444364_1579 [Prevotella scopos JCM 17725]